MSFLVINNPLYSFAYRQSFSHSRRKKPWWGSSSPFLKIPFCRSDNKTFHLFFLSPSPIVASVRAACPFTLLHLCWLLLLSRTIIYNSKFELSFFPVSQISQQCVNDPIRRHSSIIPTIQMHIYIPVRTYHKDMYVFSQYIIF